MGCKRLIFIILTILPFLASAQKDIKTEKISTWMFQVMYTYQYPGRDTKVLYNNNHSVGGSVIFKSTNNWMFSINGDYISGNSVKISRSELFGEILDNNGEIITGDGIYGSYALFERGAHFEARVGKIFPILAPNPNCGFFIQGGIGYLFNRLKCEFGSYASPPPALAGDYPYGYDKMRGGFAWSGEIGYIFMSNSRIFNFSLSLEFTQAYTKSLRKWDFNLMKSDDKLYIDQYFGIKVAIYVPTYRRKPAEYYYY